MKLFVVIIIIFFDQLTKSIVANNIQLNSNYKLTSFLDIIHIQNPGILLGFFSNVLSPWFILIVVGLVIIILFIWLLKSQDSYERWGITLIISGALGNFIDRLIHNHVTDFIYFHYTKYYWPAFNIADIFITFGVVMLIIATYMSYKYKVNIR